MKSRVIGKGHNCKVCGIPIRSGGPEICRHHAKEKMTNQEVTTHPVKLLDNWIERHNCAIEYFAYNPYYPWQQMIRPAINILSDVIEFFNGRLIKDSRVAQSGRAHDR